MKKLIFALVLLLNLGITFAQTQPPYTDPLRFTGTPSMDVLPPPPPSDGSTPTSCSAWTVKNEQCTGNVRYYEQCVQMVNSNIWNPKSQDCTEFNCGSCENGVCIQGNGEGCGSSVTPTCGNGVCDSGENSVTCPSECTSPGTTTSNNTVIWVIFGVLIFFILRRLLK